MSIFHGDFLGRIAGRSDLRTRREGLAVTGITSSHVGFSQFKTLTDFEIILPVTSLKGRVRRNLDHQEWLFE